MKSGVIIGELLSVDRKGARSKKSLPRSTVRVIAVCFLYTF